MPKERWKMEQRSTISDGRLTIVASAIEHRNEQNQRRQQIDSYQGKLEQMESLQAFLQAELLQEKMKVKSKMMMRF